jgi:hypothetical protein
MSIGFNKICPASGLGLSRLGELSKSMFTLLSQAASESREQRPPLIFRCRQHAESVVLIIAVTVTAVEIFNQVSALLASSCNKYVRLPNEMPLLSEPLQIIHESSDKSR